MIRAGLIAAVFSLAFSSAAAGATEFGVSDDHGKYADDGGAWFFSEMAGVGLKLNKMTVNWDPANPAVIAEKPFLDRAIPEATKRGIRVSLGVHIGKARAITRSSTAIDEFTEFLKLLARTYPEVTEIVVGNEPNLTRFWQPQFDRSGKGVSGAAFAGLLARSYDALKEANPNITVVGIGLSPRGNDMPKAKSNISTSPVKFIRDLGRGYRAMARAKPIMDVFGFHPYPGRDRDSLAKGYRWPNAGVANLDRIKQAIWDAFDGTGQPTFAEGPAIRLEEPPPGDVPDIPPPLPVPPVPPGTPVDPVPPDPGPPSEPPAEEPPGPPPLTFKLDEVGWQVAVRRDARSAYYGRESIKPTDERTQAKIYRDLVQQLSCDPSVRQVLFFGLIDEPNLDRWQAGLIRADRSRRPSYGTVQGALAETAEGCMGAQAVWRHTERVIGAKVRHLSGKIVVSAEEDATVRVAGMTKALRADRPLELEVTGRPVVRFNAAMNPKRVSTFR
jgi:hypothetical protein